MTQNDIGHLEDDLILKIKDAMACITPEYVRWATGPQGRTKWVFLVGLGSLLAISLGRPPKVAVEEATQGRHRKLRDFCITREGVFVLAVDKNGNDWIAIPNSLGQVYLNPSFRQVGRSSGLPALPGDFPEKVREAMRNIKKNGEVSLVQLGLEYRKIHGVSLKEDVVSHTQGVYSRFIDWATDKDEDFSILRGEGTAVFVQEKNGCPPPNPSLEPQKESEVKKVITAASLTITSLAAMLAIRPFRLIGELMRMGIFASLNQSLSAEVAQKIALKYGIKLEIPCEKEDTENVWSTIRCDKGCSFSRTNPSLWETAISGRRVYVDTGALMSQRFWQELNACTFNTPPATLLVLAPVVHELLEIESRGSEGSIAAKQALNEIKIARTAGWLRIVSSGFPELPDNYADVHFIRLSSASTLPVSIITADNRLITSIKEKMNSKFVSLFFFDRNRGILKPHFRVEIDDLV